MITEELLGAVEMAQWVKDFAAKPGDKFSLQGPHDRKEPTPADCPLISTHACTQRYTHVIKVLQKHQQRTVVLSSWSVANPG